MRATAVLRTLAVVGLILGLGAGLSACNTIEGIGKDISAAGRAMGADSSNRRK